VARAVLLHSEYSARKKNKMYYSVWEVFSLSYGKGRLMFYSSDIAKFLNKRFGVNLSSSEYTSSRTPVDLLQETEKGLFKLDGPQFPHM
jgi:hypothetical protein